jgi:hypothetical protein
MAALQTLDPVALGTVPASAVVWINGRRAIVVTMSSDGTTLTSEIYRGHEPELSYLALVVQVIGDRQRVLILGPSSVRLSLEREYVAVFRRRDRLVDVEPAGTIDAEELVVRLRALAG